MQFNTWYSAIEQSVRCVAPQEIIHVEEPIRYPDGGMRFKTPLFIAACAESVREGAQYAFEADHPEDFYHFSAAIATKLPIPTEGVIFRKELGEKHPAHWPKPERVEEEWRESCRRYDRFLSRHGFNPVIVAADIEQMVLFEKGPFAWGNTWMGKLLAGAILKQNGFAPPKVEDKATHDEAIRDFKTWVTYYEKLIRPL